MIETFTDKKGWNQVIESIGKFDFYHTYEYHRLLAKNNDIPALIKYTEGDTLIALPLIFRKISGTDYYDATSVYGYAGPIEKRGSYFEQSAFKNELHQFLFKHKVISVFSRLHPYIDGQSHTLKDLGEICFHNLVVNIDLTQTLDEQRSRFNKRLKTYINKARRECSVIEATTTQHIQEFAAMYNENMLRVGAEKTYFFDEQYFIDLLKKGKFNTQLLLVVHNETEEIISGAIFVKTQNVVQYHLSGSKTDYLHLNPLKLLIDEMRIIATQQGYTYFNLGGGKSGSEDSLFYFKSSFSKDFRPFYLWKYVVNKEVYEQLSNKSFDSTLKTNVFKTCDYFPAYRSMARTL
ncbi:MAG: GNAT family N-acetyltransferase [Pseudozobellia sp.]|nr:GNAT family N-acetyltransferase [Pseudozobellia sp.]MBG48794.1 GNAT family N-acetyltransferase [Pseudozobellia sp.]|tara:strand:+ start:5731 stop:6777 length:1047 start_codon:yes stop_codon:yes gene_type:complete